MANPSNLKPFAKGFDPRRNMKGNVARIPAISDLLEKIPEDDYQAIINKLIDKAKKGDIRAAEVLLERAWGKATQPIQMDNEVTVFVKHES